MKRLSYQPSRFGPTTYLVKLIFLLSIALSIAGCTPYTQRDQKVSNAQIPLEAGTTLGQTFLARYNGLNGFEVRLGPLTPGQGNLILHLRLDAQSPNDIATAKLPINRIKDPKFYTFPIPIQKSSNHQYYYADLEVQGSGAVQVFNAPGNTYLNGALYYDQEPLNNQMSFGLVYDPTWIALGISREIAGWFGILAAGIFLFIIPGWGILSFFWPGWENMAWASKLGLSSGLSLALYPVLLLWTNLAGLHLGAMYAWIPALAGILLLILRYRNDLHIPAINRENFLQSHGPDLAFIGVLILLVFTRFWTIRDLDVPMFGDSYQHTMIAQLIVDHGGLFSSWEPYADLQTFTYHFGFHSAVAMFHWISQFAIPQATLWTGQFINILAVLAIYPLALKISGNNRWAGTVGVLLAGLLSPMPMTYVNWGRYTQLTGQAILPAAVYFIWTMLENPVSSLPNGKKAWGALAITGITLGGLGLAHYRILVFALIFFIAFYLFELRKRNVRYLIVTTFWIGMIAGLLFLPWFVHVYGGKIMQLLSYKITTSPQSLPASEQGYNDAGSLLSYLPALVWGLSLISVLWGILARKKEAVIFSLWWFFILLAANPQWLGLPGAGTLSNFAVFIAAYIFAGVIVGAFAGWLLGKLQAMDNRWQNPGFAFSLLLVIATGIGGASQRLGDVQPEQFALVTYPDERAAAWIQHNLPQTARFLVNTFFAYGNTTIVGSDGGWWLPLLAQRQTMLPPLTYGFEQGPVQNYAANINSLGRQILNDGPDHPDSIALLKVKNIDYVYIGQRQGSVNNTGPVLDPDKLLASPSFQPIYHQDRVWIFKIVQ